MLVKSLCNNQLHVIPGDDICSTEEVVTFLVCFLAQ